MPGTLQESIARQRETLTRMLAEPLDRLAQECARAWPDRDRLDQVLTRGLADLTYGKFLYAMDIHGKQISDNVSHDGLIEKDYGRDRSKRPYMAQLPRDNFILSEAYLSLRENRPSLTAVQTIRQNGTLVGYLGADFDLRNLPLTRELYEEPGRWQQIKGDPAIRGSVFLQTRIESTLDRHVDEILAVLEELITEHGVFHVTLHFSSSRAIIWLIDDPYRYRLLDTDALVDPDICLAYPNRDYPDSALIPESEIGRILDYLRQLRYMDETIYLRAASINIFNGLISLTFSCDGSHYMPYAEFLDKDLSFWGGTQQQAGANTKES